MHKYRSYGGKVLYGDAHVWDSNKRTLDLVLYLATLLEVGQFEINYLINSSIA